MYHSNLKGVFDLFKMKVKERKSSGNVHLDAFEVKNINEENPLYNMRLIRDGNSFAVLYDGKYIRLIVDDEVMMSDTNMEKLTNEEFIREAHGNVLIAGLGIGLLLVNLQDKLKSGHVESITVIEKNPHVIKLVAPYFKNSKIKIINADIFKWRPKAGTKFDTIYFDIWPSLNIDNLEEIARLHQAFKVFKMKGGYINSWMTKYLRKERAENYF